jgi:hypothetical protein
MEEKETEQHVAAFERIMKHVDDVAVAVPILQELGKDRRMNQIRGLERCENGARAAPGTARRVAPPRPGRHPHAGSVRGPMSSRTGISSVRLDGLVPARRCPFVRVVSPQAMDEQWTEPRTCGQKRRA